MIDSILVGIMNFTTTLISAAIAPIDIIIENYLPSIDIALQYMEDFFDYILSFIPWILSWFNIPTGILTFIISTWIFVILGSLLVHTTKLLIAWYNALKL